MKKMENLLDLGELCPSNFLEIDETPNIERVRLNLILTDDNYIKLQTVVPVDKVYGKYWYRSGMNKTMKSELEDIVNSILKIKKWTFFFSEKILDFFLTCTIPKYYGCPSIDRFFNVDGILTFDSLPEIEKILIKFTNSDFYTQKLDAIKANYEIAKKYIITDDLIYKKIKNKT